MLDDEIAWLGNFVPSEATDLSEVDNALLAGHLRFIRTLFTCSSIDKSLFGTALFLDQSRIEIIQLCPLTAIIIHRCALKQAHHAMH